MTRRQTQPQIKAQMALLDTSDNSTKFSRKSKDRTVGYVAP